MLDTFLSVQDTQVLSVWDDRTSSIPFLSAPVPDLLLERPLFPAFAANSTDVGIKTVVYLGTFVNRKLCFYLSICICSFFLNVCVDSGAV
jgi:hypothetical protein